MSITISFHSTSRDVLNELVESLNKRGIVDIKLIDEKEPVKLSQRADTISQSCGIIVLASRDYQKTLECMEVINYAKDLKKDIYAFNTYSNYKPFGSLGCIAYGLSKFGLQTNINDANTLDTLVASLKQRENQLKLNDNNNNNNNNNDLSLIKRPQTTNKIKSLTNDMNNNHNNECIDALISYHTQAEANARLVYDALKENVKCNVKLEDTSKGELIKCVEQAKVILVVLSSEYGMNKYCEQFIQMARTLNKHIIPISTSKVLKLENWLALAIAGKLYYRIIDREQAYKIKFDLSIMSDLMGAVDLAIKMKSKLNQQEQDALRISELNEKILKCKNKLTSWPPLNKKRLEERPVKVVLREPQINGNNNNNNNNLTLAYQNYTISRLTFKLPARDINEKYDCMISYQWDNQSLVRSFFNDLLMRQITTWFDIYGGMLSNSNDSMSKAIESSKCFLVFLTLKYQQSINCQMEFKYALACKKPIILINLEPKNIVYEEWIRPHIKHAYQFEILCKDDFGTMMKNGISKVDRIAHALRDIANAQPKEFDDDDEIMYELNEHIQELKSLLRDALEEIKTQSTTTTSKVCTRCGQKYVDDDDDDVALNKKECRAHTGYYMGGTIIAGRWVCCTQIEQDAIGCCDAHHIDIKRVWTQDPNYGTFTWQPK